MNIACIGGNAVVNGSKQEGEIEDERWRREEEWKRVKKREGGQQSGVREGR